MIYRSLNRLLFESHVLLEHLLTVSTTKEIFTRDRVKRNTLYTSASLAILVRLSRFELLLLGGLGICDAFGSFDLVSFDQLSTLDHHRRVGVFGRLGIEIDTWTYYRVSMVKTRLGG